MNYICRKKKDMENRIKEILKEKGVTGKELAARMGVSAQYISSVVNGKGASLEAFSRIANELDVPLCSLFADYEESKTTVCPHCGKPIKVTIK